MYGTEGCHLCEEAENLLMELQQSRAGYFDWHSIDIVNNDLLFETYGTAIPVVFHAVSEKELFWPFSMDELLEFVRGCLIESD